MKVIELSIKKGCDRAKVLATLKMLRDSGLLISINHIFQHSNWLLIVKYEDK